MAVVFLNCRYKFYRSFSFLIMTRNFSFFKYFWVIDFYLPFWRSNFFKNHTETSFLSHALQCWKTYFCNLLSFIIWHVHVQGRNHWVGGDHGPPTSISQSNKVQQFQFQTSGILLFMGVKKLYGPENSGLLQCMLKFLDNLRFFNYKGEIIDHFMLDVLRRSGT